MSSVLPPSQLMFGTSATLPMTLEELSQLATAEDEDWSSDIFDEDDEIGGASPLSAWSSPPSSPLAQHGSADGAVSDGNVSDVSISSSGSGRVRTTAAGTSLSSLKVPEPVQPAVPTLPPGLINEAPQPAPRPVAATTTTAPRRNSPSGVAVDQSKTCAAAATGAVLPPAGVRPGAAMPLPAGGMVGPMPGPMFSPWMFNPMAFAAAAAAAQATQANRAASLLPTTAPALVKKVSAEDSRTAERKNKRTLETGAAGGDLETGQQKQQAAPPADDAAALRKRQKADEREERRRRNREAADKSREKRRALLAKLPEELKREKERTATLEKELAAAKAENRSLVEQNTFLRSLLIKQQPSDGGSVGAQTSWGGKVPATSAELGGATATDPNASPAGMMLMAVACLLTLTHLSAFVSVDGQTFLNNSVEAMDHGISTGRVLLSFEEEIDGGAWSWWGSSSSTHSPFVAGLVCVLQLLLVVGATGVLVPRGVRAATSSARKLSLPLWGRSDDGDHQKRGAVTGGCSL